MGSTAKLVELYVEYEGPVTIDDVARELGIRKLTIYPVSVNLVNAGRIDRDGQTLYSASGKEN